MNNRCVLGTSAYLHTVGGTIRRRNGFCRNADFARRNQTDNSRFRNGLVKALMSGGYRKN